jgi:hypothetical protein
MTAPLSPSAPVAWSAIRNLFVREAERFMNATRYEEASAIADAAAREIEALYASPAPSMVGLREKVEGPASWLNRWAAHVGGCRGGDVCTCGLTMARFEIDQCLALLAREGV